MLAVPRHFVTNNDVTGNTTTSAIDRGIEAPPRSVRRSWSVVAHLCTSLCCCGWNYKVPYSIPKLRKKKEQNKRNYIENQESKNKVAREPAGSAYIHIWVVLGVGSGSVCECMHFLPAL